ncbi:hypothetical protein NCAS_0B01030 [Naumovozyma castellii]|uniref:30 kDa heat shock protein n=1 Tax=Naumovozyma castellii TaxID=27288 RepID=G0VB63_NAUCA|nr:hypothetical protein NCAS_0B01030 [Naumovozyma castellii CBS 4309]CCC68187.1 hypothetical protein NCAS_0B01030 [Naumovozyma castellii CBS 4309]
MNATFAEVVKSSGNRAVRSNPPHDLDFHLTEQGSDWLWALFSIFGCLAVVYIAFFFIAEAKGTSLTKYALATTLLISMFNAFGYFTYASNLGWAGIQAEFNHLHVHPSITGLSPGVRQIFYAKYCAWFLSWPLLIFLNEMTGMSISEEGKLDELSVVDTVHSLLFQILGTEFWVVSLLVGSLIKSTYKWGYWVFGCVAMLLVEYIFIKRQFIDLRIRGFTMCMHITYLIIMWLYFICWGLSEGGNKIQPDSESVFYGVLDFCIFAVYPGYLCFIAQHYGKTPKMSMNMKSPFHKHHDDEEDQYEAKEVESSSPRNSGETQVQPEEEHEEEPQAQVQA